MKPDLKFILILFILVSLNLVSGAQDKKKCPMHMHCWHMSDSTHSNGFSCTMDDCSLDDFPFCTYKHMNRYNGHWAGIDVGIGGYMTSDFNMNFNHANPEMDMNTARSLMVNINPFELNANLWNNHLGFTTGLGLQISNYYFTGNYVMLNDSSSLVAYHVKDLNGNPVSLKVNKMVVSYLNLPLFLEYQTNPYRRMSSFHVTLGVIAGVRIGTYTKQVYKEKEQSYFLVDNNGFNVASFDVEHHTVVDHGTFHLNPFKVDAAFRIGWSHINLFGTYSVTRMFQKNQGPELYPFTAGITLIGW